MMEFRYTADPLAINRAPLTVTTNVGAFMPSDPIEWALGIDDASKALRISNIMGIYFYPCRQFSLLSAAAFGYYRDGTVLKQRLPGELDTATLQSLRQWGASLNTLNQAAQNYLRAINPGVADETLMINSYTVQNIFVRVDETITKISLSVIRNRVDECLAELARRESLDADKPVPLDLANAARVSLTRWRAALADARRVDVDAQAVITALQSIRKAWVEAGDFPDQVRTVDSMLRDAVNTQTWAQQAAATFISLVAVAETIANTGVGTLPPDPVLGSVVPLPTVLPARPDGTVPVVTFTPATTVPTVADTGTPVVQGRKAGAFPILATLLTLITLFN